VGPVHLARHRVEGSRKARHLVVPLHLDLLGVVPLSHRFGGFGHLLKRLAHRAGQEHAQQRRQDKDDPSDEQQRRRQLAPRPAHFTDRERQRQILSTHRRRPLQSRQLRGHVEIRPPRRVHEAMESTTKQKWLGLRGNRNSEILTRRSFGVYEHPTLCIQDQQPCANVLRHLLKPVSGLCNRNPFRRQAARLAGQRHDQ